MNMHTRMYSERYSTRSYIERYTQIQQPKRSTVFSILERMQTHLVQHIWLIIQRQRMVFVYSPYLMGTESTSHLERQTNKQIKLGKCLYIHEIFVSF